MKLGNARKNILLIGPAGTGKTYIARQLAECLPSKLDPTKIGLPFYHISCTAGMSEGNLTGKFLPVGENGKFEYVPAGFVYAYENGGVFQIQNGQKRISRPDIEEKIRTAIQIQKSV